MQRWLTNKSFYFCTLILCTFYLFFEFFFNQFAMIFADEFWFAHAAYHYSYMLPYKDFSPYKTILGYYFLLIPLIAAKGKSLLWAYIFIKNCITLLNSFVLLFSAFWLTRFFKKSAVLLSLALIITAENTLLYSTNIRVDILAYWSCLFALLLILEKRFIWAGLLTGLAFCTSQKAIWYIAAINLAFTVEWLLFARQLKNLRPATGFNLGCMGIILLYILFWSLHTSLQIVIDSVFFEAKAIYSLDWYAIARKPFWALVVLNNPLLFLLWPIGAMSFLVRLKKDTFYRWRLFLFCIVTTLFACLVPYQQIFPYYMQVTLPIFFVFYAAFFTWGIQLLSTHEPPLIPPIANYLAWSFALIYCTGIILLIFWLDLLKVYAVLCLLPFTLALYFTELPYLQDLLHAVLKSMIITIIIFIGFIYPLTLFIPALPALSGSYQKQNIKLLALLLADGSDYIAGTDFIYNKNQPIAGMQHLNGPGVSFLHQPSDPKLRAAMISSLNFDPTVTVASIIRAIQHSHVKVYINNYRMEMLPKQLKKFLLSQYQHFWGSIYIYAPTIQAGETNFRINFPGRYFITANPQTLIHINNKLYRNGEIVALEAKNYISNSNLKYRLQLQSDLANQNYFTTGQLDDWRRML